MTPSARSEGLVVQRLPDETLVYDLETDRAHCLNRTAALVWSYCDGSTSVAQMAERLQKDLAIAADERLVWLALQRLGNADLLREKPAPPADSSRNRRSVLRLGLTSALVPVVLSILAPDAIAGASCNAPTGRPVGCTCQNGSQCASGRCTGNLPKTCV